MRPLEVLDAIASALSERLTGFLTIVLYACPAAIAASGAIYLAASGVSVSKAFETHRALWMLWTTIEASALAIAVAGVVVVAPAVFRILRAPSRKVLWRLVGPVGVGLSLLMWLGVGLASGAEAEGWVVDWIGLILLGTVVQSVADFFKYVIAHSELSQSLGRVKLAVLEMAASIVVVTITAGAWTLFARTYLGPYVWIAVAVGMAFSAAPAIRSARRPFPGRIE